jgi:hypothetical protein
LGVTVDVPEALRIRIARWVACGALTWLVATFVIYGREAADQISSVIMGVVLLISLIASQALPPQPEAPDQILVRMRHQAEQRWPREAATRGLVNKPFLPFRLEGVTGKLPFPAGPRPRRSWLEHGRTIARQLGNLTGVILVQGDRGCGKSTAALALTVTLLEDKTGPTPLLLSLSSWNPAAEDFGTWLDRHLALTYSAYRSLGADPDSRRSLLREQPVIFVLDGLDEVATPSLRETALHEIVRMFTGHCPAVVFSSDLMAGEHYDAPLRRLALVGPSRAEAAEYLDRLHEETGQEALGHPPAIGRVHATVRDSLIEALDSVFFLDLFRTLLLSGSINLPDIQEVLHRGGPTRLRWYLIDAFVDHATSRLIGRHRRHGQRWLTAVATGMTNRKVSVLPWWRIHDELPAWVLPLWPALAMVPAYLLALVLPAGLTRGFALGSVVAIAFGLLRGSDIRWRDLLPAGALVAVVVLALGSIQVDPAVAVIDAAEVGVAFLFALRLRPQFFAPGWACVAGVLKVGLASAAATWAVQIPLPGQEQRPFAGVFLAITMGVGVAVLSARLLTTPTTAIRPSSLSLSVSGRGGPLRDVAFGVLAGTAVGLAGGLVGGVTHGFAHGAEVAVIFGLVAGLPVGAIGGLFTWLNRPGTEQTLVTPRTTNQRDMAAAATAVLFVTAAAGGSISLLRGPMAFLVHDLRADLQIWPIHGILFGMTIGVIVACFITAWPTYAAAHLCFALQRRVPWRFIRFLDSLCDEQILRQEGATYQFRNAEIQNRLATRGEPDRGASHPAAQAPAT